MTPINANSSPIGSTSSISAFPFGGTLTGITVYPGGTYRSRNPCPPGYQCQCVPVATVAPVQPIGGGWRNGWSRWRGGWTRPW